MKRGIAAVVAVGCLTAAGVLVVTGRPARVEAKVGRNVFANPPALIDANNTPSLARNPARQANVVLSHRIDRPRFDARLSWSDDGGTTWTPTALPLPEGLDRPFAPDIAFATDGTLHVIYVNLTGTGNVPENLWHTTSEDGGRTLAPPRRVAGRLAFQARLAVAASGTVHLTWLQAQEVALFRVVGRASVVTAQSSDGGRTFSTPVVVSDPGRERVGAASPVVDTKGRLVVLYQDFKDDRRDFEYLEGPAWSNPFALVVTRSTDGGRTFSPGVEVDDNLVPTKRFLVFLPDFPSLAAGPGDALYVGWSDGRNDDEDVFLSRSGDGGRTWGRPVQVNDTPPADGTAQYLPKVGVAPGGRVDIVFYDRRLDPDNDVMTDAFLATSADRGRSFLNTRLSSASFDSRVGPSAARDFGIDFGSRLAVVSNDNGALAAWTDSRQGTEDTGRQDVAAVAVRAEQTEGPLEASPAVLVLLAVGVGTLVALGLTRRSSRGEHQ